SLSLSSVPLTAAPATVIYTLSLHDALPIFSASGENVLIYATSNRRHLMPEYMSENLSAQHQPSGEIHPGESVEEKISLSERFGLDRKSTRLNSSHVKISYAVFCLKKKKKTK